MSTISCSIGIGCQHPNTLRWSKKVFVFPGFEYENLAQQFLAQFSEFISGFIESSKEKPVIPVDICLDEALPKVFKITTGDVLPGCDITIIGITPSNNFPVVFQEMLRYFDVEIKH